MTTPAPNPPTLAERIRDDANLGDRGMRARYAAEVADLERERDEWKRSCDTLAGEVASLRGRVAGDAALVARIDAWLDWYAQGMQVERPAYPNDLRGLLNVLRARLGGETR